jgi:hypothetical protein
MWLYHWFSENKGWTPEQVRELTLDEQFWFPVMKEAGEIAGVQLNKDD